MEDSGEPVDIKDKLEKSCALSSNCMPYYRKLVECAMRVKEHPERGENCTEELFDLTPCVDKCVSSKLFSTLK